MLIKNLKIRFMNLDCFFTVAIVLLGHLTNNTPKYFIIDNDM